MKKFAFLTLWTKNKLQAMFNEFDRQEGIAASGSMSIRVADIDAFAEYLHSLTPNGDYVRTDVALFFADEDKPGDLSGSISEVFKKEEGTTRKTRSL